MRLRDRLRRLMGAAKSGGRIWTREGWTNFGPAGWSDAVRARELRFVLGSAPIFAPGASGRGAIGPFGRYAYYDHKRGRLGPAYPALRRGLFGRKYAPSGEGSGMGPIAAVAVQYGLKLAYDHREEIKSAAAKQTNRIRAVRISPPSPPARWRRKRKVASYWRAVEHAPSCGCRRCERAA